MGLDAGEVALDAQGGDCSFADAKQRRRQFIRTHHPDHGGDAEFFVAGLNLLDAELAIADDPLPRVIIVAHRAWLLRLAAAALRRLSHGRPAPRVR